LDSAPPGDIWRQNVQKCGPLVLPTQRGEKFIEPLIISAFVVIALSTVDIGH
jgi:hypothetical protein